MAEKDTIFSSKVSSKGIFNFADFYKFCYQWLTEEKNFFVSEDAYKEKIEGNLKFHEIKWSGEKKFTDYFKFELKVTIKTEALASVEVVKEGTKTQTNKGKVEVGVKGILAKDYQGKFERSAFSKFTRSLYEKWIIPSRVEEFEDNVVETCDDFLGQVKAYLDLEGKK